MVVKKKHILNIAIILALMVSNSAFSENTNNLIQLDLRRSSDSSVDVTLVTSDNYGDNVMVRKKSDTKYVILVPKVKSSGFRASSLAGVNDLVSNVDVKTVEDTAGGYTKVTLITKKPLDIKTRTQKTSMSGSEQNEYNSLMAQANAVKNNISKREPQKVTEQKTEVTVNKTPAAKPAVKTTNNATQTQQKPKIELKEIKPENIEKAQVKKPKANLISNLKKDEKAIEKSPVALPKVTETAIPQPNPTLTEPPVEQLESIETVSKNHKFKNSIKSFVSGISSKFKRMASHIPSALPKGLGLILIAFTTIALLKKLFRNSDIQYAHEKVKEEKTLQDVVSSMPAFGEVLTNKSLSWREKYQMYLDKSAQPVKRANKKGHYSFIKTPAKPEIEEKREKLEQLVEVPKLDNRIESTIIDNLHSEDNVIAETVKFKAFSEDKKSLHMASRNKRTSRFKGYETKLPLHEQPTVDLEDSLLAANPRSLSDANLKVSDVDKKRITYEPKEYIMSSVDEYMAILDNEKEIEEVKEKLSTQLPEPLSNAVHMSSPIKKEKSSSNKNIIVKSAYKIAPKKGIYIVDKDGKNALVGKVNNKTFVLKKFDGVVTAPINVRLDNENVYMVKAGKFKSLVKVDDEKMGVLIEL